MELINVDCNNTIEFFKEYNRLCRSQEICTSDCPIGKLFKGKEME